MPWSLTASYSPFPNEAGYAQAEFTVTTREDRASNELLRTFTGRVGANTEAVALAKLSSLRTGILAGATWATLRQDNTVDRVDGEDGAAFIRLVFTEEFRRSVDSIVESLLETSDTDDAESGLIRRTYSGRVTAAAATWSAAYDAALARARALGHRKLQFQTSAEESSEDPRLDGAAVTSAPVLATVRFRYEYRLKGSRLRVNLATRVTQDTFGTDSESVSGTVVAADLTAAQAAYADVKAAFGSRLIRDEAATSNEERIGNLNGETPAVPPAETQTTHWIRLEFSFTLHLAKAVGTLAARYEIDVAQDFLTRTKVTTIQGTAHGPDVASIEDWLTLLLEDQELTNPVSSRRRQSRERAPTVDKGDELDVLVSIGFDQSYQSALTGASAILSCELSEHLECSGPRVIPQPTAAGNDVIQVLTSVASGRRQVSGSVVATDETTALAWAKRQRTLPMPEGFGASGIQAATPPRITFTPEWVPLVDGVARSGDYGDGAGARTVNVRLVRCRFEFIEIVEELTLL